MRALLLINRGSRKGEANAEAAAEALAALGVEPVHGTFEQPEDVSTSIEAYADSVDCIVLGGGDGTINLAAAAVARSGLPMAVLPLGTANDFARTLTIPVDLQAACRNVVEGVDHPVDLGQVNDAYFVNVASIGLAVRASEYRSDAAKKWFGALGYAGNVFAAFRETRPFTARIICDGQRHKLRSIQIAIGNGRHFGGGLAVAETAALDDGRLDLYSLRPQGMASLLCMMPALVRGPDKSVQGGQLLHGREIHVETDVSMPINTDGEIQTQTPATFRVLRGALTVRVPDAYREDYAARNATPAVS